MQKIVINLLPKDYLTSQQEQAKFRKIQVMGWTVIVVLVLVSVGTVVYRVGQEQQLKASQQTLQQARDKVTSLKNREASLTVLKNRLDDITKLLSTSRQRQVYDLLGKLILPVYKVENLTIDDKGNVQLSATIPNSSSLDLLLLTMVSPDKNQDKIAQVSVDGLSRIADGSYKLNLTLKTK